ncbi:hypothetical protein HSX11_18650 [Oxalobacteraceae bacterium]|nr:hypothetical protein [Oxalobacteraceae bacterium]
MSSIFVVTPSDIRQLNDKQAREFVARLCKAELREEGLGTAPITWGGDQRAADGGTDVRVTITQSVERAGYIPRNATIFQVKAESFIPSKIPKEVAPKRVLRPSVLELSKISGAYVIVSTKDDCSDTSLKSRVKAIHDCLAQVGIQDSVHHDFFDSNRLADWVEHHPGVQIWLRNILGKSLQGWRPFGAWAYREQSSNDEYLLDEKVKVFAPDTEQPIPVIEAIQRLRLHLAAPRRSVRIVGLSGVGKTRLVQALFDERIQTTPPSLDAENVIFTDISDDPQPTPQDLVESLLAESADCVVVVDNCSQALHGRLTELVQRNRSKLSLLTIEYDIRDDYPEGTACYRLEGSSPEVITQLLKRHYNALSDLDIHKIVDFSDGNARVAYALASTSEIKGQLAQLRDEQLFRRLFFQNHNEDTELLRCAQAASLLYSFDAEDESETSELAKLAGIAGTSVLNFQHCVAELMRRGLVQQRGRWRAVLPHAIANRLASLSLEARPAITFIDKLVSNSTVRVARSFSRRIGMLHESKIAVSIAHELVKIEGLLWNVCQLNELGRQMLGNIAPLAQRAVLENLFAATADVSFTAVAHPHRAHYTRLLRSLAYDKELFDVAAQALLRFALAEDENYRSDSVRDLLKSLFSAHLSGTLATTTQRARFIQSLFDAEDTARKKLALSLLGAALQARHFSSHYGFDFGALKRGYGWHPKTAEEIRNWYTTFLNLAATAGQSRSEIGMEARGLIAHVIRELCGDEVLMATVADIAHGLKAVDGWPAGWIAVRNTIRWHKDDYGSEVLDRLRLLEKILAPNDLMGKIQAKVLSNGMFVTDDFDDDEDTGESYSASIARALQEVEALGLAAASDDVLLATLLPNLLTTSRTSRSYYFGIGVAQAYSSFSALLAQIKQVVIGQPEQPVDLQFVCGLVVGRHKIKPKDVSDFLDSAIADEVWGRYLPRLQLANVLDDAGFLRLLESIRLRIAPSYAYRDLEAGGRTAPLSAQQIATLIDALAELSEGGLSVAIDILYMVLYSKDERDQAFLSDLQAYLARLLSTVDWAKLELTILNNLTHLESVIEFAVSNGDPRSVTAPLLLRLIEQQRSSNRFLGNQLGDVLRPLFEENPIAALDIVFEHADDGFLPRFLTTMAPNHYGESVLSVITDSTWLLWCEDAPEKWRFAAEECLLFATTTVANTAEQQITISPAAITIFHNTPEKREVIDMYLNRLVPTSWSGSRAAVMRQRLHLLDELNPTGDAQLRSLLEDAKERFNRSVLDEEAREQKNYNEESKSFE